MWRSSSARSSMIWALKGSSQAYSLHRSQQLSTGSDHQTSLCEVPALQKLGANEHLSEHTIQESMECDMKLLADMSCPI